MASLAKEYSNIKLNGIIYTPDFIVKKILDDIGYNTPAILGKRFVDPACGDGRFLTEAARRVVLFSTPENLKRGADKND